MPPLYVKARLERAVMMAHAQGRSATGVLLSWWWQDLAEGAGKKYLSAQAKDDHLSSFDVDDFFTAALEGTYGEG